MGRVGVPQQVVRRRPLQAPSSRALIGRNQAFRASTVYSGTANNTGTIATFPTITITGPLSQPSLFFENATAGKTVWINVTVGASQTLTVDFSTRVVTLAGVTQSGVVSVDSRWWDLAAGNNTIRSNVAATITWRAANI